MHTQNSKALFTPVRFCFKTAFKMMTILVYTSAFTACQKRSPSTTQLKTHVTIHAGAAIDMYR